MVRVTERSEVDGMMVQCHDGKKLVCHYVMIALWHDVMIEGLPSLPPSPLHLPLHLCPSLSFSLSLPYPLLILPARLSVGAGLSCPKPRTACVVKQNSASTFCHQCSKFCSTCSECCTACTESTACSRSYMHIPVNALILLLLMHLPFQAHAIDALKSC